MNSDRGQRWQAQQESRGGSAEVRRRPESRVRLSGTGSETGRDGARQIRKSLREIKVVIIALKHTLKLV